MEYFNLTIPQQNIWNLQKYYENTAISNICGTIFYKSAKNIELLKKSLNIVIDRQAGLRLHFVENGGTPKQYVEKYSPSDIPVRRFENMEQLEQYVREAAKTPVRLLNNVMYRFEIVCVGTEAGILAILNHLISDAWTLSLIAKEVHEAYLSLDGECGQSYDEMDYIDYVKSEQNYLHSDKFQKDLIYWNEKYKSKPDKAYVKMSCLPVKQITAQRFVKKSSEELSEAVKEYCGKNPVTPAVLFETAMYVYLAKINHEISNITIGIPVLNRSNAKEKNTAGMYISTMPLTVDVRQDECVSELAKKITEGHRNIFRHKKYPYSMILENVREKHDFTGNMYDVMVSFQNAQADSESVTKWYGNGYSEIPFAWHIDNRDYDNSYTWTIDYQTEVFCQPQEIEYIVERLEYILWQIVKSEDKLLKDISIIPPEEQKKLLLDFNNTAAEYPKYKCVHELFTEQAKRTPEKTALVFEDKKFTYRELDEMSNSLAHFLREKGVGRNDIVPIIAKRSWHVIVAMLGILKAGGAYMPVDPNYPKDRVEYMIGEANVKCCLIYKFFELDNVETYNLSEINYNLKVDNVYNINNVTDICYVIYTSGSTGKPKGICQTHQCLSNLLMWQVKKCGSDNYNILGDTIITFDVSVQEIVYSLVSGKCLFFTDDLIKMNLQAYLDYIEKNKIDTIFVTPSYFAQLVSYNNVNKLYNIKSIFFAGEEFDINKNIVDILISNEVKMWNQYGPAETHVVTSDLVNNADDITIGKPIANTQIYITDKDLNLLPVGVAGELCIAGDGVGKGYLNRTELTSERFVNNPFATKENGHGKVLYHTGDLARWRADGDIEYLGRIDTQVKIRGLRIELGEIESVMGSFAGIVMTAVTDKKDENGRQYLVGYYTAEKEIDEKELRSYLSSKLPKYMVPNFFVRLEEMPMTPSGKTDRKSLPVPDFKIQASEYIPPVTSKEKLLCAVLEELLNYEKVGVEDDFFELGGDSLKAIEYVAKLHDKGVDTALQNIFDYPTVKSLCEFLEKGADKKICFKADDFKKYQKLLDRNVIDDTFVPRKQPLGNVFLTGVTGFLGAHILSELIKEETGKIYCLYRKRSKDDSGTKIHEILKFYFGDIFESEFGSRIIPVAGDIESERLSDEMPSDVDTVIHAAASVKHYGSYEYFYRVNVQGTRHVLTYAKRVNAKLIHISTLSVSGNSMADDFSVYRSKEEKKFYESSFFIGQPLDNVYIHSKFEAEMAVYDAMLDGLDAKVVRVGNLTNRSTDYKFQPNYKDNAFLTRVKACLEFGLFPDYLVPLYAEFSPADKTAEGVVKIAQYAGEQCVFHLNSNRPLYFEDMLKILEKLGIKMKITDSATFYGELRRTLKTSATEYIFEAFQNDMDEDGQLIYDSNIRIMNDFTVWFMKKTGFEWNETDYEYIRGYVEYFRRLGYLEVQCEKSGI